MPQIRNIALEKASNRGMTLGPLPRKKGRWVLHCSSWTVLNAISISALYCWKIKLPSMTCFIPSNICSDSKIFQQYCQLVFNPGFGEDKLPFVSSTDTAMDRAIVEHVGDSIDSPDNSPDHQTRPTSKTWAASRLSGQRTKLSMKRPINWFLSLVRLLLKQFNDEAETDWSLRLFHKLTTLSEKKYNMRSSQHPFILLKIIKILIVLVSNISVIFLGTVYLIKSHGIKFFTRCWFPNIFSDVERMNSLVFH